MDFQVSVVPPGGGEQEHEFIVRGVTYIPGPGEYIILRDPVGYGTPRVQAFKARQAITYANHHPDRAEGEFLADPFPVVEAEPVIHPRQNEQHRKLVEHLGVTEEYGATGYSRRPTM
jgi:hypothetical protein